MDGASLDRRITLERALTVKDKNNSPVTTWTPLCTVWASYTPVSDGEKFRAGERGADLVARFVIRHSSRVADVGPADRVVFNARRFEITGAKETGGRGVGIELTTVARADGA